MHSWLEVARLSGSSSPDVPGSTHLHRRPLTPDAALRIQSLQRPFASSCSSALETATDALGVGIDDYEAERRTRPGFCRSLSAGLIYVDWIPHPKGLFAPIAKEVHSHVQEQSYPIAEHRVVKFLATLAPCKVKIGTDVAASEFYNADTKKYDLDFKNPQSADSMKKSGDELADYYMGSVPRASLPCFPCRAACSKYARVSACTCRHVKGFNIRTLGPS